MNTHPNNENTETMRSISVKTSSSDSVSSLDNIVKRRQPSCVKPLKIVVVRLLGYDHQRRDQGQDRGDAGRDNGGTLRCRDVTDSLLYRRRVVKDC